MIFDCIVAGRAIYAGPLMNRCARIASVTPIGHVLATSTVWQIARDACSTGRLCDEMSPTDENGLIWCADHGWHTFKGIKQPLEIVQIKDKVLSQRTFPETLPRLQRLSSHTADALRQNELKYAVVRSLSSGRDGDLYNDMGSMHSDDSFVKSLEGENEILKDRNRKLEEKITSLKSVQEENGSLKEQVKTLEEEITSLHDEITLLRREKGTLEERKLSSHHDNDT